MKRHDAAIDAFIDAGLDCREAGVLADAVDALLETGALDDMLVTHGRVRRSFVALAGIACKSLPWRSRP